MSKNPYQNLRDVKAITILNDGRKPSIRRFLRELPRFLKTCRIV
ncbi:transposase [Leptospira borgpetersenii serovar Hardjo]|nr:transposase [Leptospira borgpetersenii serovar Hardjo]